MKKNAEQNRSIPGRLISYIAIITAYGGIFFLGIGVGVYHWPPFSFLKAGKTALKPTLENYLEQYKSNGSAYSLTTFRYSYFSLDSNGNPEVHVSSPFQIEKMHRFNRTINPYRTGIIIMDPWVDMISEVSEFYDKIIESRIIPLVKQALTHGHPIIILTNDPNKVRYPGHNTKIHYALQTLVDSGKANLLFHQDWDEKRFADYLHAQGIESLIYTGFASNVCLIGRKTGMVSMNNQGFRIFFVPDASAAAEYEDILRDQSIHKAATKIIANWIAEIIDYGEFMKALGHYEQHALGIQLNFVGLTNKPLH